MMSVRVCEGSEILLVSLTRRCSHAAGSTTVSTLNSTSNLLGAAQSS